MCNLLYLINSEIFVLKTCYHELISIKNIIGRKSIFIIKSSDTIIF